jgi:hypothetical protein
LIVTVATIVTFEIFIQKLNANEVLNDDTVNGFGDTVFLF